MRVGRGAQLAEVIRAPQIELCQHAAVESIWDNVLRDVRIPCGEFFVGLRRFLHRRLILGHEACLLNEARRRVSQPRRQQLRGLSHHAVTFELGVRALIHDQVEGVVAVFQFAQGDVVTREPSQQGFSQLDAFRLLERLDVRERVDLVHFAETIQHQQNFFLANGLCYWRVGG